MYILIVEDHEPLAANIGEYLSLQGEIPDFATQGSTALALCRQHDYDAVVLDLNLPDMDGMEVCAQLQKRGPLAPPILMLTARDTTDDRIGGLESGAADYLTKPFSLRELHLRLRAIAGRGGTDRKLSVGDICLFPRQRRVQRSGETLALGRIGFAMLRLLLEAFPDVVTRAEIEHAIWRDQPPESDAALRRHVQRLRQALATAEAPDRIRTVRGVGYQLRSHG